MFLLVHGLRDFSPLTSDYGVFESVTRENIMAGKCYEAKLFTSLQPGSKKRKGWGINIPFNCMPTMT